MRSRSRRLHLASSRPRDKEPNRANKLRLLALFFLFDVLLIAAVLLSFQGTELVEEEKTLLQTREVYEIKYREQVITNTTVITEIIPYGAKK